MISAKFTQLKRHLSVFFKSEKAVSISTLLPGVIALMAFFQNCAEQTGFKTTQVNQDPATVASEGIVISGTIIVNYQKTTATSLPSGLKLASAGTVFEVPAGSSTFFLPMAFPSGANYSVTIAANPTGLTCTMQNGSGTTGTTNLNNLKVNCSDVAYSVSGTISGLNFPGLILSLNDSISLSVSSGAPNFTFPTAIASGSTFSVAVQAQPSGGQICSVSSNTGTISNFNVSSVIVNCSATGLTLGGSVTGLAADGLILANGDARVAIPSGSSSFQFPGFLATGAAYSVSVASQPSGWTCSVSNAAGIASANVSNVSVSCAVNSFNISGTASLPAGIGGVGLTLNGAAAITLAAGANSFSFPTKLNYGTSYTISVTTEPAGYTCSLSNATGFAGKNLTVIPNVTCSAKSYTIGGVVAGLSSSGLILKNADSALAVPTGQTSFVFPASIANGSTYSVSISTQPSGQTCSVSNGAGTINAANVTNISITCSTNSYKVGGSIAGLSTGGLVLANGSDMTAPLSAGTVVFNLPSLVATGGSYNITVKTHPSGLYCTVDKGSGVMANAAVTNVSVNCTPVQYTIGGLIKLSLVNPIDSGLPNGLVLSLGAEQLNVPAGATTFVFTRNLTTGSSYNVSVVSSPSGLTCSASLNSGTVASSNVTNIQITCSDLTYSVGGVISGLTKDGLVLTNNGTDRLAISANSTAFTFATPIAFGGVYSVAIANQPSGQICSVSSGAGPITAANVTTVKITCSTSTYNLGGSITGLMTSGLILANGSDTVSPAANATSFQFPSKVSAGATYNVTVSQQPPGYLCSVSNASGTANSDIRSVSVNCDVQSYKISGTYNAPNGLTGLTLLNNSGDALFLTGKGTPTSFQFSTAIKSGNNYNVTVDSSPSGYKCSVANGTGTITTSNVTNVVITCSPKSFSIGGSITGLSATSTGLTLINNGYTQLIPAGSTSFTLTDKVATGSAYNVSVSIQPDGLICTVSGGSGTMGSADIFSVLVTCSRNVFYLGGTVSNLSVNGLVLQNNGKQLTLSAGQTSFNFPDPLPTGSSYNVYIVTQPPGLRCSDAGRNWGTIDHSDVSSLAFSCVPEAYPLTGTTVGFASTGTAQLSNKGVMTTTIRGNGPFTVSSAVTFKDTFNVTVSAQPPGQTCSVSNGIGTMEYAGYSGIVLTCSSQAYSVSGSIAASGGLNSGLVLSTTNGPLSVSAGSTSFTVPGKIAFGSSYNVFITQQPLHQNCTLTNGNGTMPANDVSNLSISCNTVSHSVTAVANGVAIGLPSSNRLDMTVNGTRYSNVSSETKVITNLEYGTAYTASLTYSAGSFGYDCSLVNPSGTMGDSNLEITANCTPKSYPIQIYISTTGTPLSTGLTFATNNGPVTAPAGASMINAPGTFAYLKPFDISITHQPDNGANCVVKDGSGILGSKGIIPIFAVHVDCSAAGAYTLSGSVSGNSASGITIKDTVSGNTSSVIGSNDRSYLVNGNFSTSSSYNLNITTPAGMTCIADKPTGTFSGANLVANITCVPGPINHTLADGAPEATTTGQSIAVDSAGNIYVLGISNGAMDGQTLHGSSDYFISKYNSAGVFQWTLQNGWAGYSIAVGARIVVDNAGNLVIAGSVYKAGSTSQYFLAKYNPSGAKIFLTTAGTAASVQSLAVDSANSIYVAGTTSSPLPGQSFYGNTSAGSSDLFFVKYDTNGNLAWVVEDGNINSTFKTAFVGVDSSDAVYVGGTVLSATGANPSLDGITSGGPSGLYITKYSTGGVRALTKIDGTSSAVVYADAMKVDRSGNVFLVGKPTASFHGAYAGLVINKYDSNGTWQFTTADGPLPRIELDTDVSVYDVSLDSSGNIFVVGQTTNAFSGQTMHGTVDLFLAKYNASGVRQAVVQNSNGGNSRANGVTCNAAGNPFITGFATGLDGQAVHGSSDMFISKYNSGLAGIP